MIYSTDYEVFSTIHERLLIVDQKYFIYILIYTYAFQTNVFKIEKM